MIYAQEILNSFEFMTVGYVLKNARLASLTHTCSRRRDSIYKLKVSSFDLVSIRFVQFYEEYLNSEEKELYKYSSVLMELYDEKFNLLC